MQKIQRIDLKYGNIQALNIKGEGSPNPLINLDVQACAVFTGKGVC